MSRLRWIFAALALALMLGPLVARAPLFDPDEGLHAAIAQEMVIRGDYITPTFLGQPFLDKPILFFWAEAASLRLFGTNEAAVRIPPLVFGLCGMLGVALLGRALFGESAGLTAGIVYATMILPLGVSEVAVHDVGLVPFLCVAGWCLVRASGADGPAPGGRDGRPDIASGHHVDATGGVSRVHLNLALVAGVALGLSILTKGLVGLVFAGILAVCLAVYRPRSIARLAVVLAGSFIVAGVVALPWYLAMEHAHPGYLYYYFVERHLAGYLTATQPHAGRGWWYYAPIVLGGALPWTAYLYDAARDAPARALRLVLWGWFAVGFVFLSLGESKLVTYALPLFPSLAILVGEAFDRHAGRAALLAHMLTAALFAPIGLAVVQWKFGSVPPSLWLLVTGFSLLGVYCGRRALWSMAESGRIAWIAAMTVCSLAGLMTVAPLYAWWTTGRDLARALNAGGRLPPHVAVLNERIGSLVFYLSPALRAEATPDRIDEVSQAEAVGRIRADPPDAIVAVRNADLDRFYRLFPVAPSPEVRSGSFSIFLVGSLRQAMQGH